MKFIKFAMLTAALALVATVRASADNLLDVFDKSDCVGVSAGTDIAWPKDVTKPDLYDRMYRAVNLAATRQNIADIQSHQLAKDVPVNCDKPDTCKGNALALYRMWEMAQSLVAMQDHAQTRLVDQEKQLALVVSAPNGTQSETRRNNFINGVEYAWVKVVCMSSAEATAAQPDPKESFFDHLIIAKGEDDLAKGDLKDREFATLAFASDREKKTQTYDIDFLIGLPEQFGGNSHFSAGYEPFVSYQRKTGSDGVNDLDFGLALVAYPEIDSLWLSANELILKSSWETDDMFNSSLWRAQLGWTISPFDQLFYGVLCDSANVPNKAFSACDLTILADYADVANVGTKTSLATIPSYARIGGDIRFSYGRAVNDEGDFVVASASYSMRRDIDGRKANIDLTTLSLGWQNGGSAPVKFSLEYKFGRDTSSLQKQNLLSLTLGFRR